MLCVWMLIIFIPRRRTRSHTSFTQLLSRSGKELRRVGCRPSVLDWAETRRRRSGYRMTSHIIVTLIVFTEPIIHSRSHRHPSQHGRRVRPTLSIPPESGDILNIRNSSARRIPTFQDNPTKLTRKLKPSHLNTRNRAVRVAVRFLFQRAGKPLKVSQQAADGSYDLLVEGSRGYG